MEEGEKGMIFSGSAAHLTCLVSLGWQQKQQKQRSQFCHKSRLDSMCREEEEYKQINNGNKHKAKELGHYK